MMCFCHVYCSLIPGHFFLVMWFYTFFQQFVDLLVILNLYFLLIFQPYSTIFPWAKCFLYKGTFKITSKICINNRFTLFFQNFPCIIEMHLYTAVHLIYTLADMLFAFLPSFSFVKDLDNHHNYNFNGSIVVLHFVLFRKLPISWTFRLLPGSFTFFL